MESLATIASNARSSVFDANFAFRASGESLDDRRVRPSGEINNRFTWTMHRDVHGVLSRGKIVSFNMEIVRKGGE